MDKKSTPETVRTLRDNDGLSFRQIASFLKIGKTTARDWYYGRSNPSNYGKSNVTGYVNENLSRNTIKTKEEIFEFLEQLAPINCVIKDKKISKSTLSDYCLIIGDTHFPMQHQPTIDVFYQTILELQPKTIILNGDSLDMFSISRYPKDIRTTYSLLEERIEYHKFLKELISISNGADIFETNANHSGNDLSGRWFRYLSDRIGELACLPDVIENLSYSNVFLGDYKNNVNLVDFVELTPDLIVLHGDIVRKNGGYSALAHMDKWNISIIHNHTHRFGSTAKRIPSIGSRKDSQIFAWENGCACSLSPLYGACPNWQNGFSIVSLDNSNNYGIEQVHVNENKANISTLGKTIYV
jgi:hypothetical protein